MKVKDVLDYERDYTLIMYRTNSPVEDEDDILFGYASYTRGEEDLKSEDGDNYSINDVIYKYEWIADVDNADLILVVWFESEWIGGNK